MDLFDGFWRNGVRFFIFVHYLRNFEFNVTFKEMIQLFLFLLKYINIKRRGKRKFTNHEKEYIYVKRSDGNWLLYINVERKR